MEYSTCNIPHFTCALFSAFRILPVHIVQGQLLLLLWGLTKNRPQQTAQLEGDDNVHARLLDHIDDHTDDRTATLLKSFRTSADHEFCGSSRTAVSYGNRPSSLEQQNSEQEQSACQNNSHLSLARWQIHYSWAISAPRPLYMAHSSLGLCIRSVR